MPTEPVDRRAIAILALIAFLASGCFFVPQEWRIFDPSLYYAYIRSPLIDGDLDFANEAEPQEWWLTHVERTATGKFPNPYSIGPALLWAPATLLAHGGALLLERWGLPVSADGYSWPYLVLVGLSTTLGAFAGLMLLYRLCRGFASPIPSLVTVAVTWLATPLLYYSTRFTLMAHAFSFAAVALFLWVWLRLRRETSPSLWHWLGLGACSGLMVLQRWQDALLLLLVPIGDALEGRLAHRERLTGYAVWGLGTVLAFSPQMAVWQVLYGRPLLIPQGEEFFHWLRPALADTLFSTNRGLVLWTPLFLFALGGLVWLWRRDRPLAAGIALVTLLELYVNSAVWDWWGGGGFGPRRFLDLWPLLALGMAGLLAAIARQRWRWVPVALLSLLLVWHQWSWMDMVFYVTFDDGGQPMPAQAYARCCGENGPWPVAYYEEYIQSGAPLPSTFYLGLYDNGLYLPSSVLREALLRPLREPPLLFPRPSRWSGQVPFLFALLQREGEAPTLLSWPMAALIVSGGGLGAMAWLLPRLFPSGERPAVGRPPPAWARAGTVALLLLAVLVSLGVFLVA